MHQLRHPGLGAGEIAVPGQLRRPVCRSKQGSGRLFYPASPRRWPKIAAYRGQGNKPLSQLDGFRPIQPFCVVDAAERANRDPRDA
jgi:hypothetical protein